MRSAPPVVQNACQKRVRGRKSGEGGRGSGGSVRAVFVKVCGITNPEDALFAVAMGADAVGLIFAAARRARSPPTPPATSSGELPPGTLAVGVFRDERPERILEIVEHARLGGVQLHGHETPAEAAVVRRRVPFLVQAFGADDPRLDRIDDYDVDAVLLDSSTPGSGVAFDWKLAERFVPGRRVILAGGLTPDNVAQAVAQVRPWGVDVASGVEASPGPQGPGQGPALRGQRRGSALRVPRRRRLRVASPRRPGVPPHALSERSPRPMALPEPSPSGRFGEFGGRYVPETLVPACLELEAAFRDAWADTAFRTQLDDLLRDYAGRPSPLTECHRLSEELGGVRMLLKREDLNHTGSHKINNVLGQALLAQRMGKTRLVAETGAGQHGVATATAAALLGMECMVYMGEVDMERQALNVFRMRLLGAEVVPAVSGSRTLKDAVNEAMRDWVATVENTHYCLGSVMGPHPYPWMVREFHTVIGTEARAQCAQLLDGGVPDVVTACVGGGSNAIGIFCGFADTDAELVGVEPAGGAAVGRGVPGVVHGMKSYLMQDEFGQVQEAQSISAGLDYPGVGPEHSHLSAIGRARYEQVTDAEVIDAFQLLSRTEGIIPALEPAHALAWVSRDREALAGRTVLLNLSGRGDKDVGQMMEILG